MNKKNKKKHIYSFKYMGLGFQLIAVVFLFVFIGQQIDKQIISETPWGLIFMSTIGVFVSLYYVNVIIKCY